MYIIIFVLLSFSCCRGMGYLRRLSISQTNLGSNQKVISTKYEVKDAEITTMKMKYAAIDTEFNSDLYLLDGISCPNYVCTPVLQNVTCMCNYTIGPSCGTAAPGCPACPLDDRCKIREDRLLPVTTLIDGVPIRKTFGVNNFFLNYR